MPQRKPQPTSTTQIAPVAHAQQGMALVVVLILGAIGILIITLGISLSSLITQANLRYTRGIQALHLAESGAENALMRLIRNPNYSGETLTLTDGTATIVVSGTSPKVITVNGTSGSVTRTIVVEVADQNGVLTVQSWKELF